MRSVLLSDDDLEPITVIDVPEWMMAIIRNGGVAKLYVTETLSPYYEVGANPAQSVSFREVHIFGERLRRNGREYWMLITRNEELALLLKNTYLPGQLGDLAKKRKEAFIQGILAAISGGY